MATTAPRIPDQCAESNHGALAATDLLTLFDLASHEVHFLLELGRRLKADYTPWRDHFAQRAICLLFEKPSLRTRVSFEVGFARFGGTVVYLDHQSNRIGERESIADYGRNLERWCDALVARVHKHATLEALAAATRVPVVNALCDQHHPVQALADMLTLTEHGFSPVHGHLAWVGDGNNVCRSLVEACAALGCRMTVVTPPGFELDAATGSTALARAMRTGARLSFTTDIAAIAGADAVYTDCWISMGEADSDRKRAALQPYQVNARLMQIAGPRANLLHCLPAHRGEEVTDEVIDSPNSIVFDQAENRMHMQNALLLALLDPAAARAAVARA